MAQILAISMKRRVEVVHGELFSFSLLHVPKKLKTLDTMNLSPFAETFLDYGLSEEIEVNNMQSDQVPDIKIVEEEEIDDDAEHMHFSEVPNFMAEEAEAASMEIEDEREEFEQHNNMPQAPIFWTGFF